jgi:hypothetical protein
MDAIKDPGLQTSLFNAFSDAVTRGMVLCLYLYIT